MTYFWPSTQHFLFSFWYFLIPTPRLFKMIYVLTPTGPYKMSYLPVFISCIIIFIIAIFFLKNPNLALQSSESAVAIIQIWQQGSWNIFFLEHILPCILRLQLNIFYIIIYDTKRYRPSYLLLCMHFSILRQAFPSFSCFFSF